MSKFEKIILAIIIVILIAILIVCFAAVIYCFTNLPETVSNNDNFNTALWMASPANPASPVGILLR